MPWPDFTELSFGFCFLREFERHYVAGGSFPRAPDFISQYREATEGHDVEIALEDSTPVFLQFKRSLVLTRRNAKEISDRHYDDPDVFRMYLHKKNDYAQHAALQRVQRAGNHVFYVTSQISSHEDLSGAYLNGTVVSASSALFSPSEIDLPNLHEDHHVSFKAFDDFGYIYSFQGRKFERRFAKTDGIFPYLSEGRQSTSANRERLVSFVDLCLARIPRYSTLAELVRELKHPVAKASVLAYFYLDAQLTFFQPEVEQG